MNRKDIVAALASLGWRIETDEVGDKVAYFDLSDRIVDIIPDIRRVRGEQQLSISPTLSTSQFINSCQHIVAQKREYTPLARAWKSSRFKAPEILEEHVRQASEAAIAWAQGQDLDQALQEYAALPTTAPGARPVWHLGALSVLGDVERLKFYQASFESGDRLGFVNYVTKDYIDRALSVAEQSSASSC